MKHALVALLALTTPAVAEDCAYRHGALEIRLLDAEHALISGPDQNYERCGVAPYPDSAVSFLTCESDWGGDMMLASSTPDGTEMDLLILMPFGVFYRVCFVPT